MVTIKASHTIVPSESTPNGRLWLSDNDQIVRRGHVSVIYVYKLNTNLDSIGRILRDSLSKILVHYYPIAGRLNLTKSGRLELDCNAKGALLLEAETTKAIDEYGDFSPKNPLKELIPTIDYTPPIEEIPLLVVQLTKILNGRDKGVAIGVVISHPLLDGLSFSRFLNTWTKVTRGHTLDIDEMFPIIDRLILKSPHPPMAPRFDHPELNLLPLILGSVDSTEEQKKKITAVNLRLTSKQVEKLKKMANDQSEKKRAARPYSRYEAIVAHMWRCASKARQLDDLQPSRVRFIVDIRNKLNPPIPQNYFGNATAPTVSPICYIKEITSKPLSYVAQKIREARDVLTEEYIRSQQDYISGKDQLDKNTPPFYGNPNLSVVSWMGIPFYDTDFGWGKPTHFGPGVLLPYDMAIIIGSPGKDGPVIISMHFQVAHMKLFIKYFWQDMLDSRL